MSVTIKVKDQIKDIYTDYSGEIILDLILSEFDRDRYVIIDMEGIGAVTSNFVASAFVPLLDTYSMGYIREHLHFVNTTYQTNILIKNSFRFSKKKNKSRRVIQVERVCIDNTWLGIGGNTPWNIEGMITNIEVTTFTMTDKVNVEITFDSGYILESIVTECKYLYK